jgi:tetratricopeptide (TPR) repeat protein
MNDLPQNDEFDFDFEFERLYNRLLLQRVNAFFCIIANAGVYHNEIAERMRGRFPGGELQVIDFGKLGSNYVYSCSTLTQLIENGARILFLANFQLACGDLSDEDFFQTLNLSRDGLAELPCVLVFMMPLYFRIKLARNAPDFNSFFQYHADFTTNQNSQIAAPIPETLSDGYSETKKKLLEYYLEKYDGLNDYENKQAFETILKILDLNSSVRSLHFVELKRFFDDFERLLSRYQNEFDASASNIANVYDSQGEYAKALLWYSMALAIREKVLGAEHPDTAEIYNNIAGVYDNQGDYAKALELYSKVLAIEEKVLGAEHPSTATTYNNIAVVYYHQGDYAKALSWFSKSYRVYIGKLGDSHPYTIDTKSGLKAAYQNAGLTEPFEQWFQRNFGV